MKRLMLWLKLVFGLNMYKYPLKQNSKGYLPSFKNKDGNYQCPNCGGTDFGIKDQITVTCKSCFVTFRFLGVMGFQQTQD